MPHLLRFPSIEHAPEYLRSRKYSIGIALKTTTHCAVLQKGRKLYVPTHLHSLGVGCLSVQASIPGTVWLHLVGRGTVGVFSSIYVRSVQRWIERRRRNGRSVSLPVTHPNIASFVFARSFLAASLWFVGGYEERWKFGNISKSV